MTIVLTAQLAGSSSYAMAATASTASSNSPAAPVVIADSDQSYFWTEAWQALEQEFERDRAAGELIVAASVDDVLGDLLAL